MNISVNNLNTSPFNQSAKTATKGASESNLKVSPACSDTYTPSIDSARHCRDEDYGKGLQQELEAGYARPKGWGKNPVDYLMLGIAGAASGAFSSLGADLTINTLPIGAISGSLAGGLSLGASRLISGKRTVAPYVGWYAGFLTGTATAAATGIACNLLGGISGLPRMAIGAAVGSAINIGLYATIGRY